MITKKQKKEDDIVIGISPFKPREFGNEGKILEAAEIMFPGGDFMCLYVTVPDWK